MALIAVHKPVGPTSHDVVAAGRKQLQTRRVGHAGTLDPLASGVLLLLTEEHTRLSPWLTGSDKVYRAWVSFGGSTPTLDAEGPLEPGTPPDVADLEARLPGLFPHFLALTEQLPPGYSAIKQQGVKGYEAARRGEALDLPPRPAGYVEIGLLAVEPRPGLLPQPAAGLPDVLAELPTALISVTVRAGTYIRAFARDLGEMLGSGAFLAGLERVRAGRVSLEQTVAMDRLAEAEPLDPLTALGMPQVELDAASAARIRQGQRLPLTFSGTAALTEGGRLVAIASDVDGRMKLHAVFPDVD